MLLHLPTAILSVAILQAAPPSQRPEMRVSSVSPDVRLLGPARWRFDTFVTDPSDPDRAVVSIAPTFWRNDASHATLGVRLRSNVDGYDRWTVWINRGLSDVVPSVGGPEVVSTLGAAVDVRLRLDNPRRFSAPGRRVTLDGWVEDGTVGARVALTKTRTDEGRPTRVTGVDLSWVATQETAFLDDRIWDNAGTIEAGLARDWIRPRGSSVPSLRIAGRVGWAYAPNRAFFSRHKYTGDPFVRITAAARWATEVVGFDVGLRGFGGFYLGGDPPLKQRAITVHGADPYDNLMNPFVRTRSALLRGPDVFYHAPGNLNMRGFRPGPGGRWGASVNLDVERAVMTRSRGPFRGLSFLAFWDGALVDTVAVASFSGLWAKPIYDAGVGVRTRWQIGDVAFPLRLEFPLYVSSPFVAHNRRQGTDYVEFRWLVSVQPNF